MFSLAAPPTVDNMQRVVILGEPGSGKSTLARLIGQGFGLQVVHLDQLYWTPGWIPEDFATFKQKHDQRVMQDRWVIEGLYTRTWDLRLERADTVVWLDLPLPLRLYRVTRRILLHFGKVRTDAAPGCPEKLDWRFYQYILQGFRKRREGVMQKLHSLRPDQQVTVLRSPREVEKFLAGMGHPEASAQSSKQH